MLLNGVNLEQEDDIDNFQHVYLKITGSEASDHM